LYKTYEIYKIWLKTFEKEYKNLPLKLQKRFAKSTNSPKYSNTHNSIILLNTSLPYLNLLPIPQTSHLHNSLSNVTNFQTLLHNSPSLRAKFIHNAFPPFLNLHSSQSKFQFSSIYIFFSRKKFLHSFFLFKTWCRWTAAVVNNGRRPLFEYGWDCRELSMTTFHAELFIPWTFLHSWFGVIALFPILVNYGVCLGNPDDELFCLEQRFLGANCYLLIGANFLSKVFGLICVVFWDCWKCNFVLWVKFLEQDS
jgi:hypothetical protein